MRVRFCHRLRAFRTGCEMTDELCSDRRKGVAIRLMSWKDITPPFSFESYKFTSIYLILLIISFSSSPLVPATTVSLFPLCHSHHLISILTIFLSSITRLVMIMHLLPLLSMVSLALSTPLTKRDTCVSQEWAVQGFTSFTADPGPEGSSHISFRFVDPNTDTISSCGRTLPPGSGRSSADPDHFYPCDDASVQYEFDGSKLTLKHTYDCHGYASNAPNRLLCNPRGNADEIH